MRQFSSPSYSTQLATLGILQTPLVTLRYPETQVSHVVAVEQLKQLLIHLAQVFRELT